MAVGVYDDGWAIRALPPGRRDLGCFELWERSLERSRRSAVAAAQRALGIPADGVFGPQTDAAVRAFQASYGLEVDGVIGPATRAALGTGGATMQAGESVAMALQRLLGVAADGEYGPVTRAAVRAYQQEHGLVVDGVAGPQTLGALGLPTDVTIGEDAPFSGATSVLDAVRSQVGKSYAWGGNGPDLWDCSGLTVWAFRSVGISLPRTTYGQVGMGAPVDRASIQPGDLVFWDTDGSGPSHVGVATSATTAISSTSSSGVVEHTITGPYWGERYIGTRRLG